MNLEYFSQLSLAQKGGIVFGNEVAYIGYREYYNQKLVLYDCGGFFAEVYYSPDSNEISKIDGFSGDDKRLDRYIDFMAKKD